MNLEDDVSFHYLNLNFSENFLGENDTNILIQRPFPIHKPLKDTKTDLIQQFHDDTSLYIQNLSTLQKDFAFVKDKITDQMITDSCATVTNGFLECLKTRPERQFLCDYNPYYASGLLEYINLNDVEYLVRPDSKNNIFLTKLSKPWKKRMVQVETPFQQSITGISINISNHLLLKHKNEVNLLEISEQIGTVKMNKQFKMSLLDSHLSKLRFGVILTDLKFQLYDIETNKKINLETCDTDSVMRCEFTNDTISLLGQKHLKLFDERSDNYTVFEPQLQPCNLFCSAKILDNTVYLASRHYLIRSDTRFLKNYEFCSHLMPNGPCYMDLVDGFLCLSNQKVEEKVMFCGNPINSLPLKVPSVIETYNECRLRKDILLLDDIKVRLKKSTGGVKLIHEDDDLYLYSVNILGDIFKQKVTNNSNFDEMHSIESFYYWTTKLPKIPKPLHLTHVENMSLARFALNKRIEQEHLKKFSFKTKKTSLFLNHFNNIYSEGNLGELAQNFLSIWEEEEEERPEDVTQVPEVASIDKVTSWIESNSFF